LNTYYAKRDDCITMEPSIAFIRALKYSNDWESELKMLQPTLVKKGVRLIIDFINLL
jgi:hypothetical protein